MESVIVGLHGGTGNQMFQYALGLALSLKNNVPLIIDLYGFTFDKFYKRKYVLEAFNIDKGEFQTCYKPYIFNLARFLRYLSRKTSIVHSLSRHCFIVEQSKNFDERFLNIEVRRPMYLMGYWQDERYFNSIKNKIREEFSLKHGFSHMNEKIAKIISDKNAVALHCRRMHEVRSEAETEPFSQAQEKSITLNFNYYQKAIEYIANRINNPHFFVFSDMPKWARENLQVSLPITFLENNRGLDYEDILLMSLCKHHIIANSSFSWWGAWLGEKEGQIVISPKNAAYTPNIPERWIRVE